MEYTGTEILCREKLMTIFVVILGLLLSSSNISAQQLEIEWDGSEEDVIRLIALGKMRFSLEGHTLATPDRITFKIRSGDTLINALTLYEGGTVRLEKVDTILMNTTNVVRKEDGTLGVRQYKVGDFAHGGIIFWVDETGEHGLVADTADISTNIQWYNGTSKVTNATGNGVSSGEMNTMLIIAQQTVDNTAGSFAALLCANLIRGPYGDWYLPSKEELNLMYQNKARINATAIANGGSAFSNSSFYWSSSEFADSVAWGQDFFAGDQLSVNKLFSYSVRAIRAF